MPDGSYIEYEESPKLYWDDDDFINTAAGFGPGKWYHSKGPYNENARQYECVLFYVNGLYRETVVFEIEYEMNNAALRYGDSSELYIALYSGETVKYLENFHGQVLVPLDKMPSAGNYEAYTCGTNANSFPFTESTTTNPGFHTFSFTLDEKQLKFRPYNQYIEFVLISFGADKHKFTQYASHNAYYEADILGELRYEMNKYQAESALWRNYKLVTLVGLLVATFLLTLLAQGIVKGIKKKYSFYESVQDIEFYRDIPSDLDPCFVGELALCKGPKAYKVADGMAAAMLSLIHKGYIGLERIKLEKDWKQNNIKIVMKQVPPPSQPQPLYQFQPDGTAALPIETVSDGAAPEQPQPHLGWPLLSPTETIYLDLIRRHIRGEEIEMNLFQKKVGSDYDYTASFLDGITGAVTTIGVKQGYLQKHDYKKPRRNVREWLGFYVVFGILLTVLGNLVSYQTRLDLAFGGFFILGLGCLANAAYLEIQARKLLLFTQLGADEYAKWRGLYNFLNSETIINERTHVEVVIWEKYLIYATAFGIADKVLKALQVRCPEAHTSPVLRNPYVCSAAFYAGARSFSSSARTASYASGSGGHGGYGGGGRGGGGGGGGH
jgi:uncharacterized membrane protein